MSNNKFFLHSTYKKKDDDNDGAVVCYRDMDDQTTKLQIFRNLQQKFYILKKGLWNPEINSKPEYVPLTTVDEYTSPTVKLIENVKKALGYHEKKYISIRDVLNDYRVFGANIPIEVLIKQNFNTRLEKPVSSVSVGAFDIETSVLGGEEIILITYTSSKGNVYTGLLKYFLKDGSISNIRQILDTSLTEFYDKLNSAGKRAYDRVSWNFDIQEFKTEPEIIKWIFDKIHEEKDEFISIWNIAFDIPYILKRMSVHGMSWFKTLCHPEVPFDLKTCAYREDKSKVSHWSRAWHTFNLSGYSQFYDAMSLFSILRIVDGIQPSYQLRDVANEILGASKLEFGDDNHHVMQESRFEEYTAYNIVDTILLILHDRVTNDAINMISMMLISNLECLGNQTVRLTNVWYDYCKQNGLVSGSCSSNQEKAHDEYLINVGGGVLSPTLARNTGVNKLKEIDTPTDLTIVVSDLDVVSQYPNACLVNNASRETRVSTVLEVENCSDVTDIFGHYVATEENAVYLGSRYLNLPDFTEISKIARGL